jgi:hypothetical protein
MKIVGFRMAVKGETVRAINSAYAKIDLSDARTEELPIELEQLRLASEMSSRWIDFDIDPFDHRVALIRAGEVKK